VCKALIVSKPYPVVALGYFEAKKSWGRERERAEDDIDNIVAIYQLLRDVGTRVTSGAGQDHGRVGHGRVS
jgi:hypothetical protein